MICAPIVNNKNNTRLTGTVEEETMHTRSQVNQDNFKCNLVDRRMDEKYRHKQYEIGFRCGNNGIDANNLRDDAQRNTW